MTLKEKHIASRIQWLINAIKVHKEYLLVKFENEDWHAVADAAMDIRDFEAELKGLRRE